MVERIDPDFDPTNSDVEDVVRLAAAALTRIGSVHYRNGNGKGGWRDWVLGVTMLLAASGIGGVIFMYGDQSRLSQAVSDLKEETLELKHDVKELTNTIRNRRL